MSLSHHNPPDEDREATHKSQTDLHAEVRKSLSTLFNEGAVVELRAFGSFGNVVSGYFDDHDALAAEAMSLERLSYQVYVTLNEIGSDIQPRITNSTSGTCQKATTDRDIVRRRLLLVDIDPVRPANLSSTDEEQWAAYYKAVEIRDYLRGEKWPEPVIANSGNGFHFLYPIGLPNNEESRELVKGVLLSLASQFDDDRVKVDTSVHNAARIVRLYGTVNRKGDSTEERPHRRSRIIEPDKEVV